VLAELDEFKVTGIREICIVSPRKFLHSLDHGYLHRSSSGCIMRHAATYQWELLCVLGHLKSRRNIIKLS
jgi:hypothetical protein